MARFKTKSIRVGTSGLLGIFASAEVEIRSFCKLGFRGRQKSPFVWRPRFLARPARSEQRAPDFSQFTIGVAGSFSRVRNRPPSARTGSPAADISPRHRGASRISLYCSKFFEMIVVSFDRLLISLDVLRSGQTPPEPSQSISVAGEFQENRPTFAEVECPPTDHVLRHIGRLTLLSDISVTTIPAGERIHTDSICTTKIGPSRFEKVIAKSRLEG